MKQTLEAGVEAGVAAREVQRLLPFEAQHPLHCEVILCFEDRSGVRIKGVRSWVSMVLSLIFSSSILSSTL